MLKRIFIDIMFNCNDHTCLPLSCLNFFIPKSSILYKIDRSKCDFKRTFRHILAITIRQPSRKMHNLIFLACLLHIYTLFKSICTFSNQQKLEMETPASQTCEYWCNKTSGSKNIPKKLERAKPFELTRRQKSLVIKHKYVQDCI